MSTRLREVSLCFHMAEKSYIAFMAISLFHCSVSACSVVVFSLWASAHRLPQLLLSTSPRKFIHYIIAIIFSRRFIHFFCICFRSFRFFVSSFRRNCTHLFISRCCRCCRRCRWLHEICRGRDYRPIAVYCSGDVFSFGALDACHHSQLCIVHSAM